MASGITVHDKSPSGFELSLANEQSAHVVDAPRLLAAARRVLAGSKFTSATISLAVVDDPAIHALNQQFLQHDYPTDVLSFVLDAGGSHLNGEVVFSADTAAAASAGEWSASDEQLLYVIHGMLHLIGMNDQSEADARKMRAAERYYLQECGVAAPDAERMAGATDEPAGGGGTADW